MKTPFWNAQHFRDQALAEWNRRQPAWTTIKRYNQLSPAQQSIVDDRAEELELAGLLVDTAESVRRMET